MKALCSLLLALGAWSFFGLFSLAADSPDPSLNPSALGHEGGEFGFVNSLPRGELLSNGTFEDLKGQDKSPAVSVKPIAENKDLNFAFPLLFVMLAGAIRLLFRSDAYKNCARRSLGHWTSTDLSGVYWVG